MSFDAPFFCGLINVVISAHTRGRPGGQMGNGITQVTAVAGLNVNMVDVSEDLLSK